MRVAWQAAAGLWHFSYGLGLHTCAVLCGRLFCCHDSGILQGNRPVHYQECLPRVAAGHPAPCGHVCRRNGLPCLAHFPCLHVSQVRQVAEKLTRLKFCAITAATDSPAPRGCACQCTSARSVLIDIAGSVSVQGLFVDTNHQMFFDCCNLGAQSMDIIFHFGLTYPWGVAGAIQAKSFQQQRRMKHQLPCMIR